MLGFRHEKVSHDYWIIASQSNHTYVFSPCMWVLEKQCKNQKLLVTSFTVGVAHYMHSFSFIICWKYDLWLFPSSLKIFLALQYTHKLNTTAVMAHSKVGIGQE